MPTAVTGPVINRGTFFPLQFENMYLMVPVNLSDIQHFEVVIHHISATIMSVHFVFIIDFNRWEGGLTIMSSASTIELGSRSSSPAT